MKKIPLFAILIGCTFVTCSAQTFSQDSVPEKFEIVEDPAMPKKGYQGFYSYIRKKLKYPKSAKKQGLEGKVYVQFVITQDGSADPESIQIASEEYLNGRGSDFLRDAECEEEALRLIREMDPWIPPKQKEKPVKQRIILPITFKL